MFEWERFDGNVKSTAFDNYAPSNTVLRKPQPARLCLLRRAHDWEMVAAGCLGSCDEMFQAGDYAEHMQS